MTEIDDMLAALTDIPKADVLKVHDTFSELSEAMDGATDRQVFNAAVRELPEMVGLERAVVRRVVLAIFGTEEPPAREW